MSIARGAGIPIDQWALLEVVCASDVGITSKCWVDSFKAVNLHPLHMVSIEDFLKRSLLAREIVAGETAQQAFNSGSGGSHTFSEAVALSEPAFLKNMMPARKNELLELTRQKGTADWDLPFLTLLESNYAITKSLTVSLGVYQVILSAYCQTLPVLVSPWCCHRPQLQGFLQPQPVVWLASRCTPLILLRSQSSISST